MMRKVYWKARSILTENERVFYNILAKRIDLKCHLILCKVRMEDIIYVDFSLRNRNFAEYQRARGRMRNRHFDFVICDIETQEIQRIIELDGWTHKKDSEKEADKFKDEACLEAGLKLVRINYNEMNFPDQVIRKIIL